MTTMKKIVVPALALAAASVAVPAAAQSLSISISSGSAYTQNYGGWQNISQRKYQLDRRIDRSFQNRRLSSREANRLKSELNALVRLEARYARGGLTRWERNDLDRRYDGLAAQVREERRDGNGRRW